MEKLINKMNYLSDRNNRTVIAIDGRCCSGKTTLALKLSSLFNCSIVKIDDFFLPKKTQKKMDDSDIAGNIDKARFIKDVIKPLKNNKEIVYKRYDCMLDKFTEQKYISEEKIIIIEGVYALYPTFRFAYHLSIFLDVDKDIQMKRLINREEEEKVKIFLNKWILKEEAYFKAYAPQLICDYYFNTSNWEE